MKEVKMVLAVVSGMLGLITIGIMAIFGPGYDHMPLLCGSVVAAIVGLGYFSHGLGEATVIHGLGDGNVRREGSGRSEDYKRGARHAAELASMMYDGSSLHPYMLEDCILHKMNLLPSGKKVRRNQSERHITVTQRLIRDLDRSLERKRR